MLVAKSNSGEKAGGVPDYQEREQSEMRQRRQLLVARPLWSRSQRSHMSRDDPCLASLVRLETSKKDIRFR